MAKKKHQQTKWGKWLIGMFVVIVFVLLRLLSIKQSFWFFGDLGRDLFVLQDWARNIFHPPLLGPQTSVISFNQSALYYYYLWPFFLITGHSVYSTLLATLSLYLAVFIGAFVVLKKQRHWWKAAALFFLIAIHPQFVLQHRYVWNPSLVTPFLLIGFWAWWRYQTIKDWRLIGVLVGSLALATGLNFSLVPTVLVIALIFLWEQRGNKRAIWQFILLGLAANLLVHLPTLVFELRHGFLLTKNLPTQELLQQEASFEAKISQLSAHLFLPDQGGERALVVGVAMVFLLLFVLFRSERLRTNWVFVRALQIASFTTLLMLSTPFRMHEHYVFGILTFLLVALARLPKPLLMGVLVGSSLLYLSPFYRQIYGQRAPHSVAEQRVCMQQTCQLIQEQAFEPIFVNTQSASHNHQAREYVFWLRELGCQAIDTQEFLSTPTNYMAVVADRAEFTNGSTGYYELSQFGPAEELQKISCKNDLNIYLLKSAD